MCVSTATQTPDMVDSYRFATYFNAKPQPNGGQAQFNEGRWKDSEIPSVENRMTFSN